MTMNASELLARYDWEQAFLVSEGEKFDPASIRRIIGAGMEWGDYAETKCVGIFELNDGRFGYVSASCDMMGWDCCVGGTMGIADSIEKARTFLSPDELRTLDAGILERP